jgi:hypothetical protein
MPHRVPHGIGMVGTIPQLGVDVESLLQDMVMHSVGAGVPRSAAPGDTAPAPASSGAVGPGVSGLYLPGSPGFPPSPINKRRVGDEAEYSCSRVTATGRLLHDKLALVDQNILHPIQVGLKREENLARIPLASSMLSHPVICFLSTALVPG